MNEQNPNIIEILEKIQTEADLVAVIPPEVIEFLGGGDEGKKNFLILIKGLGVYAPGISTAMDLSYKRLIPFDENGEYLGDAVAERMFKVAQDLGLITIDPNDVSRFIPNTSLYGHLIRIFGRL